MSDLSIRLADSIMSQYGERLARLSGSLGRTVLSRAINHEGDKARTRVKRTLKAETGIAYGRIEGNVRIKRAYQGRLAYEIAGTGNETNIGDYKARRGATGVSAAPWNSAHLFRGENPPRGSFFLPGRKHYVVIREGRDSYPLKPLFGPNLGRELVREYTIAAWRPIEHGILARIGHEIGFALR